MFCQQLVLIILILILILFLLSKTQFNVPVAPLSARDNQKLTQPLSKGFESQFAGVNINMRE